MFPNPSLESHTTDANCEACHKLTTMCNMLLGTAPIAKTRWQCQAATGTLKQTFPWRWRVCLESWYPPATSSQSLSHPQEGVAATSASKRARASLCHGCVPIRRSTLSEASRLRILRGTGSLGCNEADGLHLGPDSVSLASTSRTHGTRARKRAQHFLQNSRRRAGRSTAHSRLFFMVSATLSWRRFRRVPRSAWGGASWRHDVGEPVRIVTHTRLCGDRVTLPWMKRTTAAEVAEH